MQAEQPPSGSPVGKARSVNASKLPVTAISMVATPPAPWPPQHTHTVNLNSPTVTGGDSFSFSVSSSGQGGDDGQQLAQGPPSPPPAAAKSPSRTCGSPVMPQHTTWKSQTAIGPPSDLKWSPTIERLIMNSTKQVGLRAINVRCENRVVSAGSNPYMNFLTRDSDSTPRSRPSSRRRSRR
jgi:hypothetical protein